MEVQFSVVLGDRQPQEVSPRLRVQVISEQMIKCLLAGQEEMKAETDADQ
jgi:hypothetical protein